MKALFLILVIKSKLSLNLNIYNLISDYYIIGSNGLKVRVSSVSGKVPQYIKLNIVDLSNYTPEYLFKFIRN